MVLVFDRALTSVYRQAMNHTIDPAAESHRKPSCYYISNQMPNFPGPRNRKSLFSPHPFYTPRHHVPTTQQTSLLFTYTQKPTSMRKIIVFLHTPPAHKSITLPIANRLARQTLHTKIKLPKDSNKKISKQKKANYVNEEKQIKTIKKTMREVVQEENEKEQKVRAALVGDAAGAPDARRQTPR